MSVIPDPTLEAPIGRAELRTIERRQDGRLVFDTEIWITEGDRTRRWRLTELGRAVMLESAGREIGRLAREVALGIA